MRQTIILLIIIICVACSKNESNKAYLKPEVTVEFPYSIQDTIETEDGMKIYMVFNDSVSVMAGTAEAKSEIIVDSILTYEEIDANLFKYIQSQMATKYTVAKGEIGNHPIYRFMYQSPKSEFHDISFHEGILFYHGKHMVIIEYRNDLDLFSSRSEERIGFLNSLKIK